MAKPWFRRKADAALTQGDGDIHSLKLTTISHLKIGPQKEFHEFHLPTIDYFSRRFVSFREGKLQNPTENLDKNSGWEPQIIVMLACYQPATFGPRPLKS